MPGPHRDVYADLLACRARAARRPRYRVPFPDLSTSRPGVREPAPFSATPFAGSALARRTAASHPDALTFPSATTHKQGPMLITPGDIASGRVRDFGGAKPNHNLT